MTISPFDPTDITARAGPRYRAIADALRDAIRSGTASPGMKLPPVRDLAYALGVTVGTVSRAYALAASRGEVAGEVGRGTYVLDRSGLARGGAGVGSAAYLTPPDASEAAMKAAYPPSVGQDEIMGAALSTLLAERGRERGPSLFNSYPPPGGTLRDRQAAAAWLAHDHFTPTADDILVCSGAQQAILTAILTATRPGDMILTEAITYHAMVNQAVLTGRRVIPVDMDAEGVLPAALERLAQETHPAALFIVPTLHNPTSAIMGEERRQQIADIARAHDITIIEDDIYGKLVANRPLPLAYLAPDQTWYLTSLAKTVGCGLRIGFLLPPPSSRERARAVLNAQGQTAPSVMMDLATRLIETGSAESLCTNIVAEMQRRHDMTACLLTGHLVATHPASLYAWLELPENWRATAFVDAAQKRGVAIAAGEDFMVGRTDRASRHVRLAIGQPQDCDELERGLEIISALLSESHIHLATPA